MNIEKQALSHLHSAYRVAPLRIAAYLPLEGVTSISSHSAGLLCGASTLSEEFTACLSWWVDVIMTCPATVTICVRCRVCANDLLRCKEINTDTGQETLPIAKVVFDERAAEAAIQWVRKNWLTLVSPTPLFYIQVIRTHST